MGNECHTFTTRDGFKGLSYRGGEGSLNFEVFEFTPSILLENALLASRKNITFIIHLLLLHPLKHICFTV